MTIRAHSTFSKLQPLLAAALASALAAQDDPNKPAPTPKGADAATAAPLGDAAAQDPAAQAAAAAAEAEQKKQEQEAKKQERIQKIQQVVFDRRPTTILRTWNAPPEKGVVNGETPPPSEEQAKETASVPMPMRSSARRTSSLATLLPPQPTTGGAASTSAAIVVTGRAIAVPVTPSASSTTATTLTAVGGAPASAEPTTAAPAATDAPPTTPDTPFAVAAEGAGEPTKPEKDPFDLALVQWARAVTLGDWAAVKTFLASLESDDEKKAAWKHMIGALGQPPQDQNNKPFFAFADVIGLCAAAPRKKTD